MSDQERKCINGGPPSEDEPLTGYTESISNDGKTEQAPKKMTRQQKLIMVTFCLSNFGINVFYSLLGPFFPLEARRKGLDSTTIGLVFGVYELIVVICSPILGIFLMKIGPKFMFIAGILSCGYCTLLFAFLDMSPPGVTFSVLAFAVRSMEGIGAAAMMTSSFAIVAHSFPDRVATMFGTLEVFSGLGLMVGPPIGGLLYQLGGFRLPFLSSGSVLILLGIGTLFILPKSMEHRTERPTGTVLTLLSSPLVLFAGWLMLCCSGSVAYLDVALAPLVTDELGLTPVFTGLIFLIGPAMYAIIAPIWGTLADKIPTHSIWLVIGGYIFGGLAFFLLGPAPFLGIGKLTLWMVILSQVIQGVGLGTMVVGFQLFTTAARDKGMPDTLATYGLVSGVFSSAMGLGAFLGPVGGGALLDKLGFAWASAIIGLVLAGSSVITAVYIVFERLCCPRPSPPPEMTIQEDKRTPILHGNGVQTDKSGNI